MPGRLCRFVLSALPRLAGKPTTFVGLIQDNAVQPIGNAHIELEVAGANTNPLPMASDVSPLPTLLRGLDI